MSDLLVEQDGPVLQVTFKDGDDIVARVYGSADFAMAVAAFARKERATWTGE